MNGVELRRQVRVDANVNGHDQSDTSPTFFLRASATNSPTRNHNEEKQRMEMERRERWPKKRIRRRYRLVR